MHLSGRGSTVSSGCDEAAGGIQAERPHQFQLGHAGLEHLKCKASAGCERIEIEVFGTDRLKHGGELRRQIERK